MTTRAEINAGLKSIGACWAVSSSKYCGANDGFDAQVEGKKTYHVHPDAACPLQRDITRFDSLKELASWIAACKRAAASDDVYATVVWTESGYDVA